MSIELLDCAILVAAGTFLGALVQFLVMRDRATA
jgi:hypothetical protein